MVLTSDQQGDIVQSISISATWQCNFIDETNIFFILLTITLQATDRRAPKLNVSYYSDDLFYILYFIDYYSTGLRLARLQTKGKLL
jgi:hypothetical protein